MENICRWEKVQKKLAEYATDESDDEGGEKHRHLFGQRQFGIIYLQGYP